MNPFHFQAYCNRERRQYNLHMISVGKLYSFETLNSGRKKDSGSFTVIRPGTVCASRLEFCQGSCLTRAGKGIA